MEEQWKDIQGYEGLYKISNRGKVWDLLTGKIKKTQFKSDGYETVALSDKLKKQRHFIVSRLVAIAFIPNPYNKPHVHHSDENKSNNCEINLMWVTEKEHGGLRSENHRTKFRNTYQKNLAKRKLKKYKT